MATAKKALTKSPATTKSGTGVAASKRPTIKKAAPAKAARKPNAAFMKAMTPSPALAAVIGTKPLPRTEVTKAVWVYIKKHGLQDPKKRTMINADDKLRVIFKKPQVSMFEMTKLISDHLQ